MSFSPSHSPLALVPGSFLGYSTPCANGMEHSGMSGEPGEAESTHGGWDEGVHRHMSDNGRGFGGWGHGLGVS